MRSAYVIIAARIQLPRNLFLLFSGPLPYNNGIREQNGIRIVIRSPIRKGSCNNSRIPARKFCRIFWKAKPIATLPTPSTLIRSAASNEGAIRKKRLGTRKQLPLHMRGGRVAIPGFDDAASAG